MKWCTSIIDQLRLTLAGAQRVSVDIHHTNRLTFSKTKTFLTFKSSKNLLLGSMLTITYLMATYFQGNDYTNRQQYTEVRCQHGVTCSNDVTHMSECMQLMDTIESPQACSTGRCAISQPWGCTFKSNYSQINIGSMDYH